MQQSLLLVKKEENQAAFHLHQAEINQQVKKLSDLVEQAKIEDQIIHQLNQKKEELVQAEKELLYYQSEKFDFAKAREKKYSTIPLLQKEIEHLEVKASRN